MVKLAIAGRNSNLQTLLFSYFKKPISHLVLLNSFEHEYTSIGRHNGISNFELFVKLARNNRINLTVVNGGKNIHHYHDANKHKNIDIVDWDTSFFTAFNRKNNPVNNDNLKYFFISFNNRSHNHRCLMIDLLAEKQLDKISEISWRTPATDYNFKYWNNLPRYLDQHNGDIFDHELVPEIYNYAFFQIVNESTSNLLFLTEKTVTPLVYRMPFVVYGAKGFHAYIKSLGFELYEELFDYSFDIEENLETRFKIQTEMISKIPKHPKVWKSIRDKLKDKLIYNSELADKISVDKTKFPKVVLDILDNNCNYTLHDNELFEILKRLNIIKGKYK